MNAIAISYSNGNSIKSLKNFFSVFQDKNKFNYGTDSMPSPKKNHHYSSETILLHSTCVSVLASSAEIAEETEALTAKLDFTNRIPWQEKTKEMFPCIRDFTKEEKENYSKYLFTLFNRKIAFDFLLHYDAHTKQGLD